MVLELEVPDNQVLLSDEELWHYVLNNWYLNPLWFNDDYVENDEFDRLFNMPDSDKEKTWSRIFDVSPFDNENIRAGKFIQATFWEIKKKYIKKVYPIKWVHKEKEGA